MASLFELLQSPSLETAAAKAKPAKAKVIRIDRGKERSPVVLDETPSKLMMFVTVETCLCCGKQWKCCSRPLVTYQGHRDKSLSWSSPTVLKGTHLPRDIPREVQYSMEFIQTCDECFRKNAPVMLDYEESDEEAEARHRFWNKAEGIDSEEVA